MWRVGILGILVVTGCPDEAPPDPAGDTTPDETTNATATPTPSTSASSSGPDMTDEGSSESTDGVDPMACGQNQACLGLPPLGWTGPIVIAKGATAEDLPKCKGAYKTDDVVRFEGFHAPAAAECSCSCALDPNQCDIYLDYYSSASCNTYLDFDQPAVGCYEFSQPVESFYISSYYFGSCLAESEEVIPEMEWDAVVRGCGGAPTNKQCDYDGRLCYDVPADGYESEVCYIAEGDIPCPPGTDYGEKTIRYTALTDSRDCTSCMCGNAGGGFKESCVESYDFFSSDDCSGSPDGTATNYDCNDAPGAQSIDIVFDTETCPVTNEPEPEGEAAPEEPWTYCCASF